MDGHRSGRRRDFSSLLPEGDATSTYDRSASNDFSICPDSLHFVGRASGERLALSSKLPNAGGKLEGERDGSNLGG